MIKRLKLSYAILTSLGVVLILLGENGILPAGAYGTGSSGEYFMKVTGILLMVAGVPLGLKFLTLPFVRREIEQATEYGDARYEVWCMVRLVMLYVPLFFNLLLYYITMDTTHVFCAVISVIGLVFCWPSEQKMFHERGMEDAQQKEEK